MATELPETLNAIIWIRQGKVKLALANLSGAMMIQATAPTAFGLLFTNWMLDPALLVAGVIILLTVGRLCLTFSRGVISRWLLASMALFYGCFAAVLFIFEL